MLNNVVIIILSIISLLVTITINYSVMKTVFINYKILFLLLDFLFIIFTTLLALGNRFSFVFAITYIAISQAVYLPNIINSLHINDILIYILIIAINITVIALSIFGYLSWKKNVYHANNKIRFINQASWTIVVFFILFLLLFVTCYIVFKVNTSVLFLSFNIIFSILSLYLLSERMLHGMLLLICLTITAILYYMYRFELIHLSTIVRNSFTLVILIVGYIKLIQYDELKLSNFVKIIYKKNNNSNSN